jgi:hypothetical protein
MAASYPEHGWASSIIYIATVEIIFPEHGWASSIIYIATVEIIGFVSTLDRRPRDA